MNSWKNNNLLPTDKETFIDAKMNNLMNFLNAEDLSSNENIINEVHLSESTDLKEATAYDPKTYSFAASGFRMTLDELESMVKTNFQNLNDLILQDAGIQSRYRGIQYSEKQWLQKINYLRENVEFYKPEKFGTRYVKGYRSITLNKYLDFNQEQPGICWSWSKEYQQWNEKDFILHGTGNGRVYLLRLKAAFKNSDIDWVKTVYLIQNDEGELRLHPDGKAYILDKLIYSLENKNKKELGVGNVSDYERKDQLISLRTFKKEHYNPETRRYDIPDISKIDKSIIYKNGKFLVPIGLWNGDLKLTNPASLENCPTEVRGTFSCYECKNLTSLKDAPEKVGGDFDCHGCENLTSLEGAPREVGGYFNCRECNNLTSLEGAPEYVGGNFNCNRCQNLTSLEGAPKEVGGGFACEFCGNLTSLKDGPRKVVKHFYCYKCENLSSLEGTPEYVGGDFDCNRCQNLTSLEGAPKEVGGYFNCCECNNLTSLEGAPEYVGGYFDCSKCADLGSLIGAPEKVDGNFDCLHCNNLTSLEGAPKEVGGDFRCSDCNNLTSLKGTPREVGGWFDCSYCSKLTSLEGAPEKVGEGFNCYGCKKLISLEGAPREVGRYFGCSECGKQFTEEEIKAVCNVKGKIYN